MQNKTKIGFSLKLFPPPPPDASKEAARVNRERGEPDLLSKHAAFFCVAHVSRVCFEDM